MPLTTGKGIFVYASVATNPAATVTANWVNRTVTQGGTVASSTQTAVSNYVSGCFTDGYWSKLSAGVILPLASDGFAGLFSPLIAPAGATFINNGWVAGNYLLNDGLDGTGNTNKDVTVGGMSTNTVFASTSVQVSSYERNNGNLQSAVFGASASGTSKIALYSNYQGSHIWDAFQGGAGGLSTTQANGLVTALVRGTTREIHKNGVLAASNTVSGTYPASTSIKLFSADNFGYLKTKCGYIYFGPALTAAEETQHYNRIQTLQTALGRNV